MYYASGTSFVVGSYSLLGNYNENEKNQINYKIQFLYKTI